MGMIYDPRQTPGKSGMGMGLDPRVGSPANRGSGVGMDPRLCCQWQAACAEPEQLHLLVTGSRMSSRLASVAVITRGRRARRRHNRDDIRFKFRFRMLMLSAGLMLQCQLT
jgi:hypothetical protein